MEWFWAIIVGALFATAIFQLLRRNLAKLAIGLILLSNAANLLIFSSAGLTRGKPPMVPEGVETLAAGHADPLPQALILTAIVISFGVIAFFLALLRLASQRLGITDLEELKE
ncbi:NADH-quinone oxidoreductase subunit K [Sulfidibacter corallicola]|uniref:NADH-quinone oxidoreductase subunit K n=1 Tax=Sulfidibacter corallicola TaxID=2818388 RepID=A0A8A4TM39_SULCO|nr:NADH-quinone oxidoreductase subunit K [Sulfidibacter corallicola]QTD49941.1 NADH-quinone oxidoreductase subunit K [Sulfidibacter corallicola]